MTRQDILQCAHEPFGDAFYYGPERLAERYDNDEAGRVRSGFSKTTYQDVLDRLDRDGSEQGKRVFIKDMAYYLMPPNGENPSIAPSLRKNTGTGTTNGAGPSNGYTNGVNGNHHVNGHGHTNGVNGHTRTNGADKPERRGSDATCNPTVIPLEILKKFHWAFLIRHPRRGIPSYVRCCSPPLSEMTGWDHFMPSEAGYAELRRLFEYLREQGLVGPSVAGQAKQTGDEVSITVLDADELLDRPEQAIRAFCEQMGVSFKPDMLEWDDEANQKYVANAFAKWNGWHNDAINSTGLTARTHAKKPVSEESENEEWRRSYGEEGQRIIRACVDENTPHYEYLKSFALKF
ncbi:hypothetical protein GGR50DRAFT_537657 [Xylaria sp. CBS 124048]|nr:hypothetical protein GGR50DRAFT_537657 [Xylaria sp. CBS 124048]